MYILPIYPFYACLFLLYSNLPAYWIRLYMKIDHHGLIRKVPSPYILYGSWIHCHAVKYRAAILYLSAKYLLRYAALKYESRLFTYKVGITGLAPISVDTLHLLTEWISDLLSLLGAGYHYSLNTVWWGDKLLTGDPLIASAYWPIADRSGHWQSATK